MCRLLVEQEWWVQKAVSPEEPPDATPALTAKIKDGKSPGTVGTRTHRHLVLSGIMLPELERVIKTIESNLGSMQQPQLGSIDRWAPLVKSIPSPRCKIDPTAQPFFITNERFGVFVLAFSSWFRVLSSGMKEDESLYSVWHPLMDLKCAMILLLFSFQKLLSNKLNSTPHFLSDLSLLSESIIYIIHNCPP